MKTTDYFQRFVQSTISQWLTTYYRAVQSTTPATEAVQPVRHLLVAPKSNIMTQYPLPDTNPGAQDSSPSTQAAQLQTFFFYDTSTPAGGVVRSQSQNDFDPKVESDVFNDKLGQKPADVVPSNGAIDFKRPRTSIGRFLLVACVFYLSIYLSELTSVSLL